MVFRLDFAHNMPSPGTIDVYVAHNVPYGRDEQVFTIEKELIARVLPIRRSFFADLSSWNLPGWTSGSFTLFRAFLENDRKPALKGNGTQISISVAECGLVYAQAQSFN